MTWLSLLTALSVLAWLYLLVGRRSFWRAEPRLEREPAPPPAIWPEVVAVVPARNEATDCRPGAAIAAGAGLPG